MVCALEGNMGLGRLLRIFITRRQIRQYTENNFSPLLEIPFRNLRTPFRGSGANNPVNGIWVSTKQTCKEVFKSAIISY